MKKQIVNEMCNYPRIVWSALFLFLPADTRRFPIDSILYAALEDTFKCK